MKAWDVAFAAGEEISLACKNKEILKLYYAEGIIKADADARDFVKDMAEQESNK